ncbi:MAG: hypothetical protein A3I66_07590 [Burkholderiales bacterium RIFCSPLOWO2_02_FULL_57_36]|nr:MAG: hypothetical protein A3I66_07590 [Burkholderiales bacterium RIFCSPLOWO2_02_FULL_57_36]
MAFVGAFRACVGEGEIVQDLATGSIPHIKWQGMRQIRLRILLRYHTGYRTSQIKHSLADATARSLLVWFLRQLSIEVYAILCKFFPAM